ncbi:pyridoxal phosphate-dependent aminotransferase [Cerasicoccus fimbriatus]|uniref:pyridoxal phosphate-dependent aminotransferase n=1 Tax=Cerasicoccus fimbriatus TaxID=3014554 RepID=UPI0022B2EFDE|nr:pyridoxal phosphate-dependent aminotransferase [Cerasicoccus sp. TK19100]
MPASELKLSPWASNISPSPTLAVDAKAKALKAEGKDVCGFGAGEPDFDTPEFIKQACEDSLRRGDTKYAPAAGIPKLRAAIAEKYINENGVAGVKSEQVVVSPGGKFSCYLAILAVCGPGDEVIIPAPYWVSYPEMVKLAGATPKVVFAGDDQGFKITPEQLKEAITPKTKLLVLNSPSNPTGALYSKAEIEAIMAVAIEAGIYVMSDEIYEYLLYDGVEFVSPASLSEEAAAITITVSGFSKTFSMTGWRLGTLMAPMPVAKAVANLQSQTSSNATTFVQYGALAAMENPEKAKSAIAEMLTVFDRRRLTLLNGLNAIDGVRCDRAQGAFYLFPNISSYGLNSTDFSAKLLEQELVAVVPGVAFGADDYVRLSYATSDEVISKGLERLTRFCGAL